MGATTAEGLVELFDKHWNAGDLLEVVMLYEAGAENKGGETYYKGLVDCWVTLALAVSPTQLVYFRLGRRGLCRCGGH